MKKIFLSFFYLLPVCLGAMQSRQELNTIAFHKKLHDIRIMQAAQDNLYVLEYGALALDTCAVFFAAKTLYNPIEEPDFSVTLRSGITAAMFYIAGGVCHRIHDSLDTPLKREIATLEKAIDIMQKNRKITRRQTSS